MTLTRYPYTTIRRINYLYSQPRWEVAAPQDPCSAHHQSVRGEFLRWEDAVQVANQIAVNAGVRIPIKRPRHTIATLADIGGDQS